MERRLLERVHDDHDRAILRQCLEALEERLPDVHAPMGALTQHQFGLGVEMAAADERPERLHPRQQRREQRLGDLTIELLGNRQGEQPREVAHGRQRHGVEVDAHAGDPQPPGDQAMRHQATEDGRLAGAAGAVQIDDPPRRVERQRPSQPAFERRTPHVAEGLPEIVGKQRPGLVQAQILMTDPIEAGSAAEIHLQPIGQLQQRMTARDVEGMVGRSVGAVEARRCPLRIRPQAGLQQFERRLVGTGQMLGQLPAPVAQALGIAAPFVEALGAHVFADPVARGGIGDRLDLRAVDELLERRRPGDVTRQHLAGTTGGRSFAPAPPDRERRSPALRGRARSTRRTSHRARAPGEGRRQVAR